MHKEINNVLLSIIDNIKRIFVRDIFNSYNESLISSDLIKTPEEALDEFNKVASTAK